MSTGYQRIIVVTDGLSSSDAVHATARNLAKKHGASLTLVDTVKTPNLMARWFSSNADDVFEMVVADKQNRLKELATMFDTEGIPTEHKVLIGSSSSAITKEVLSTGADLVIRYKKGVHSRQAGVFGNTARSLMRFCPCPLLFVGKEPVDSPSVLACFDVEHDGSENTSIFRESMKLADAKQLSGVFCWDMYAKDLVKHRMSPESFAETMELTETRYRKVFDEFLAAHSEEIGHFQGGVKLENGEPEFAIPKVAKRDNVDVVVMCSAALNHPLKRMIGSTVESVIERVECALLVVKPEGFVSSISLED